MWMRRFKSNRGVVTCNLSATLFLRRVYEPLRNFISITTTATLVKKDVFFLELAKLVLRQKTSFFPQTICVSLRKQISQGAQ